MMRSYHGIALPLPVPVHLSHERLEPAGKVYVETRSPYHGMDGKVVHLLTDLGPLHPILQPIVCHPNEPSKALGTVTRQPSCPHFRI
jgi:hypothetical protein